MSGRGLLAGLAAMTVRRTARRRSAQRAIGARWSSDATLLVDSGTSALTLALWAALARRPGAVVALPAYGCYDLATAARGAGARVLLYDLDPATLGPDAAGLETVLAAGPAAVVLAYLYGVAIDAATVAESVRSAGALFIEDAAQASGVRVGGRTAGTFGDLVVLSFGRGKGLAAGGGGALLGRGETGRDALMAAQRRLEGPRPGGEAPARGWPNAVSFAAQWLLGRPSVYGLPASLPFLGLGETHFRDPRPPGRMSDFSAGVVPVALALEEAEVRTRRARAHRFAVEVDRIPCLHAPCGSATGEEGCLRFPVVVEPELRSRFDSPAARRLGIVPGYPESLDRLPGFGDRCVEPGNASFRGAHRLARCLFTLPTHGRVTGADEEALVTWLRERGSGE